MKLSLKRILILCMTFILTTSAISYAGNLVKKVYFSSFPIHIDGENYSSENPILTYQNKTYVPLREFSEMVGVDIDFKNGEIYIDTEEYDEEEKLDSKNLGTDNDMNTILGQEEAVKEDGIVVYVSKTGVKYHKTKQCTKSANNQIELSKAIKNGYTACLRCYKNN